MTWYMIWLLGLFKCSWPPHLDGWQDAWEVQPHFSPCTRHANSMSQKVDARIPVQDATHCLGFFSAQQFPVYYWLPDSAGHGCVFGQASEGVITDSRTGPVGYLVISYFFFPQVNCLNWKKLHPIEKCALEVGPFLRHVCSFLYTKWV